MFALVLLFLFQTPSETESGSLWAHTLKQYGHFHIFLFLNRDGGVLPAPLTVLHETFLFRIDCSNIDIDCVCEREQQVDILVCI